MFRLQAPPTPRILVQQVGVFTERVDPYDLEHKKPYLRGALRTFIFLLITFSASQRRETKGLTRALCPEDRGISRDSGAGVWELPQIPFHA